MQSITIDRRFRGPPHCGNGGYVCGMLARNIAGAAEVTLRAPPPLDVELSVVAVGAGLLELRQGMAVIAMGRAITLDVSRLERATYAEAIEAEHAVWVPLAKAPDMIAAGQIVGGTTVAALLYALTETKTSR